MFEIKRMDLLERLTLKVENSISNSRPLVVSDTQCETHRPSIQISDLRGFLSDTSRKTDSQKSKIC